MHQIKRTAIYFILLLCPVYLFGQNKPLDFNTYKTWPIISGQAISNDGKFIAYCVNTPAVGNCLWVQASDQSWKRSIPGIASGIFTEDSQKLVFMAANDSLGMLNLRQNNISYLTSVSGYQLPKNGDGHWIAYQKSQPEGELVIFNMATNEEKHFTNVKGFQFNDTGSLLWLKTGDKKNKLSFQLFNTETRKITTIDQGSQIGSPSYNKTGDALCFTAKDHSGTTVKYYKAGMDSATTLADSVTAAKLGMIISNGDMPFFNKDRTKVFFEISKPRTIINFQPTSAGAHVGIHDYRGDMLRFQDAKIHAAFTTVVDVNQPGIVTQLQKGNDNGFICYANYHHKDYAITYQQIQAGKDEHSGYFSNKVNLFIIDAGNGSRKLIKKQAEFVHVLTSITGKYIIWYDLITQQWLSCNVEKATCKAITAGIKILFAPERTAPNHPNSEFGIAGWLENDAAVIIQSQYDLWQMDPDGEKPPINLTMGYGSKNHTNFNYLSFGDNEKHCFHKGDILMLSAFNYNNKLNGFFKLTLGNFPKLEKLIMEPKMYWYFDTHYYSPGQFYPFAPIKAKFASKYLVERMSANEYPNLLISNDLVVFQPLTNFSPQKEYNWYDTELYHWKLPDGKSNEGVLYKPQNFDPKKKYPIIFFYYETYSNLLNDFIHPDLCNGSINIPCFVSNGYLVFVPDIQYKDGYPGKSALDAVVSAAQFLAKKPFVDKLHMGLNGFSFGGFETNYIVSHTRLFAAAASGAGVAVAISGYGGGSEYYESGQGRIGYTIWQRPDLYMENSPFLRADKVTTPLLINADQRDSKVDFKQGMYWFNALSSLHKKAWLVSYDNDGHGLDNENNQLDYSIRVAQFFDHYLKGKPAPKWMTGNIDPSQVTTQAGLELDTTGAKP